MSKFPILDISGISLATEVDKLTEYVKGIGGKCHCFRTGNFRRASRMHNDRFGAKKRRRVQTAFDIHNAFESFFGYDARK